MIVLPSSIMALNAKEIEQAVLQTDDFGFEMKVNGLLKKVDEKIMQRLARGGNDEQVTRAEHAHGGTYVDGQTGKPRQFDFQCTLIYSRPRVPSIVRRVSMGIECKNLNPDSPLIVCGRSRTQAESCHAFIQAAWENENRVLNFKQVTANRVLYSVGEFEGKSIVRLKRDVQRKTLEGIADADVYDRWSQAIASCQGLAQAACAHHDPEGGRLTHRVTFVLPAVIVPDGLLWQAAYGDDGSLPKGAESVEECTFYVGRQFDIDGIGQLRRFPVSHIHFFTLPGFDKFVNELVDDQQKWFNIFHPSAEIITG